MNHTTEELTAAVSAAINLESQARAVLASLGGAKTPEAVLTGVKAATDLFRRAQASLLPVLNTPGQDDPKLWDRFYRLTSAVEQGEAAERLWRDVTARPEDPFSRLLAAWRGNGYTVEAAFDPAREGSDRTVKATFDIETEGAGVRVVSVEEVTPSWSPDRSARWEVPPHVEDPYVEADFSRALWEALFRLGGVADGYDSKEIFAQVRDEAHPTLARWLENNIEAGYLTAASYDEAQRLGPWWSDRRGYLVYTITDAVKPRPPAYKGVPLPVWWYDFEDLLEHGQGRVSTREIKAFFEARLSDPERYEGASADREVQKLLTLVRVTGIFGVETVTYETFTRTYVHAHGY